MNLKQSFITIIILSIALLTLGVFYWIEHKNNNELETTIKELSGTNSALITFSDAMVDFTVDTNEYLLCLWEWMRQERRFSDCGTMYPRYRDDRNVLYENGIVDYNVEDR